MIQNEKVAYMTKMAVFETREGKKCEPMRKYFRKDYLALQIIKSFLYATAGFALLFVFWCVYQADDLMARIDTLNYAKVGIKIGKSYLVCMAAYIALTYAVYSVRYVKGKRKLRRMERYLKKVKRFYRKKDPSDRKSAHTEKIGQMDEK
ncbi:MAG: hypothetical protein ACI4HI_02555 [Lachnospiraceae bacterium]